MAKEIKTGDGRTPAKEEDFEGPKITEQVIDMFNSGRTNTEEKEEEIGDLDMGDGSDTATQHVKESPVSETVAAVEEVIAPSANVEEESSPSNIEEEVASGNGELIELRAEVLAMKAMMGDPNSQISLQAPAEGLAPPPAELPANVPHSTPLSGSVPTINAPTEEEFAEIMSDPVKFTEFFVNGLALYKQQTLADTAPMLTNQIMTYETIKNFFAKEDNKDIASGTVRQLVIQYAGQLESTGQYTGIANTLEKAGELVRTRLQIAKSNGPVRIGRDGLQAAQNPGNTPARRFAGGNQTRKAGKEVEEVVDETDDLIEKMFHVGGRV